jgi:hypothetical protein
VSGQLHAPAASLPWLDPPLPISQEAGSAPGVPVEQRASLVSRSVASNRIIEWEGRGEKTAGADCEASKL